MELILELAIIFQEKHEDILDSLSSDIELVKYVMDHSCDDYPGYDTKWYKRLAIEVLSLYNTFATGAVCAGSFSNSIILKFSFSSIPTAPLNLKPGLL